MTDMVFKAERKQPWLFVRGDETAMRVAFSSVTLWQAEGGCTPRCNCSRSGSLHGFEKKGFPARPGLQDFDCRFRAAFPSPSFQVKTCEAVADFRQLGPVRRGSHRRNALALGVRDLACHLPFRRFIRKCVTLLLCDSSLGQVPRSDIRNRAPGFLAVEIFRQPN